MWSCKMCKIEIEKILNFENTIGKRNKEEEEEEGCLVLIDLHIT